MEEATTAPDDAAQASSRSPAAGTGVWVALLVGVGALLLLCVALTLVAASRGAG